MTEPRSGERNNRSNALKPARTRSGRGKKRKGGIVHDKTGVSEIKGDDLAVREEVRGAMGERRGPLKQGDHERRENGVRLPFFRTALRDLWWGKGSENDRRARKKGLRMKACESHPNT